MKNLRELILQYRNASPEEARNILNQIDAYLETPETRVIFIIPVSTTLLRLSQRSELRGLIKQMAYPMWISEINDQLCILCDCTLEQQDELSKKCAKLWNVILMPTQLNPDFYKE